MKSFEGGGLSVTILFEGRGELIGSVDTSTLSDKDVAIIASTAFYLVVFERRVNYFNYFLKY